MVAHALDERADREQPHGRLPGAPFTAAQAPGEHDEQQPAASAAARATSSARPGT